MYSLSQLVISVHFFDYEETEQDTSCGNSAMLENQACGKWLDFVIQMSASKIFRHLYKYHQVAPPSGHHEFIK